MFDPLLQFELTMFTFWSKYDYILYSANEPLNLDWLRVIVIIPLLSSLSILLLTGTVLLTLISIVVETFKNRTPKYNLVRYVVYESMDLVKTMMLQNLSLKKTLYFPFYFFLFWAVILCNIIGLIPSVFTTTSAFGCTLALALTHYIALNYIGVYVNKWESFRILLPSGVPVFIMPVLILIELISYLAKVFSLSIRLFANMMSGHALIDIISVFASLLLCVKLSDEFHLQLLHNFFGLFPWTIITVVFMLEVLIASLQAYVFMVLNLIYMNDILSDH